MPSDNPGVRIPPPLLYAGAYLAGLALERRFPLPRLPAVVARPLGGALALLGAALPASGATLFRRRRTSVLPHRRATALVTSGPYALTRNPMYVGFALAHAGLALRQRSTGALLALVPALAAVDRLVIAREERYLARAFGEPYRAYTARVRRWL